jgi:hypothetical protein
MGIQAVGRLNLAKNASTSIAAGLAVQRAPNPGRQMSQHSEIERSPLSHLNSFSPQTPFTRS